MQKGMPKVILPDLFHLRLPSRLYTVRIAMAAAREIGGEFGFTDKLQGIELVVEEAAANVLHHAYDPSEEAFYEVSARLEEEFLVFRVQDQGIPMESFNLPVYDPSDPSSKGLGTHLMKTHCDEFRYLNLGLRGKAFEFMFRTPSSQPRASAPSIQVSGQTIDLSTRQVDVRLFQDADAPRVARCLYQTYRYSYLRDFLYVPEQMIRMNRSREVQSIVAVLDDNSVIGHIAIIRGENEKSPEVGQAFVSPLVRHGGVYKRLQSAAMEHCRRLGYTGCYAETVTVHPYTQKVCLEFGGAETALHLAYIPAEAQFRGIREDFLQRLPVLVIYMPLQSEPPRSIYVPRHHQTIIGDIYRQLGIQATFYAGSLGYAKEKCYFDFRASQLMKSAHVRIHASGADLAQKMRDLLRFFFDQKMELVLAELSLQDSSVEVATRDLESLGFFFSGIMPHGFKDSDSLFLQYLRVPELRKHDVILHSEFACGLLDYIVAAAGERLIVVDVV